jgi:ABC-type glycerol-3-phosphate transport system permease component
MTTVSRYLSGITLVQSRRLRDLALRTSIFLFLCLASLSYVAPLAWMLSTALKGNEQLYRIPSGWIPNPILWDNFVKAVNVFPFVVYLRNSVITSVIPVFGVLVSSTLVAYAFARVQWVGRDIMFMIVLATLMMPFQVTFIPTYVIFAKLNMINTFYPLLLPSFFGGAWNIFFIRQFFRSIPMDLSDAAIIDGCSHFDVLWRIMVPLAKPALATIAVFTFMHHWNDLFAPIIYLNKESMYTLQIGLTYFMSEIRTEWQLLMAASLLVLTPSIVIFFLGQKYFVQGITMTGIKG